MGSIRTGEGVARGIGGADAAPPGPSDGPGSSLDVCEQAPQIMFRCGKDGHWGYVNRRFYEVTGTATGSALGDGWRASLHPDDVAALRREWGRVADVGGDHEAELRLKTQSGAHRWHLCRWRAVRTGDGAAREWIGAMTDIHDLRARATGVEDRALEMARSHADLEAFGRVVAHDLREPLRSIRLITGFIREDNPGIDARTAERLLRLDELTTRAEHMVGALLEHSRAGHADLDLAGNDLAQVVAETVDTLRGRIAEAGGEVAMVTPLPVVVCDRMLIGEVFANLITNGLKFNRSDRKRIEVGAIDPGSAGPTIFVRDNGIGIDPGQSEAVFRIFGRLNPRGEFGDGVGAGLPIARRIVERHGGRIWFEQAPGGGTTFLFTLPRGTVRPAPPAPA